MKSEKLLIGNEKERIFFFFLSIFNTRNKNAIKIGMKGIVIWKFLFSIAK
jgi:hypothetical protein